MMRTARSPARPRKRYGQHFLADAWAAKVVDAIRVEPGDTFLEIGPGTGALTRPLAATGVPLLAIEIDRDLAADLARHAPPNVTILTGDFLTTDVLPLLKGLVPQGPPGATVQQPAMRRMRAVGNLPYYITAPILIRLLEIDRRDRFFADAVVMVQREVADRLAARVGTKAYGALTMFVGARARVTRLLELPPGAFRPAPKVTSTMIRLEFGHNPVRIADDVVFDRLVKAMFSHRRKTLANALKAFDPTAAAVLGSAGIDARRRPETLAIAEVACLVELFTAGRPASVL
jgi:16S rRNA (adenine1518-N6/adenine1519-N6)-dimethyltransferase